LDARLAHRVCQLWHSYLTSSERRSLLHHLVHIDIDAVVELDIDEDSAQKQCKYVVCGFCTVTADQGIPLIFTSKSCVFAFSAENVIVRRLPCSSVHHVFRCSNLP
jgi:hypothetical protein